MRTQRVRSGLLALLPEARTSLLLFGFFIAKVLMVTRGDLVTALGVVNASGVVAVAVGAVLSVLPTAAAILLAVALYLLTSGAWKTLPWAKDPVTVWAGSLTVAAGLVLTPWPLFIKSGLVGLGGGVIDQGLDRWRRRHRNAKRVGPSMTASRSSKLHVGMLLAIGLPVVLSGITGPLGAMWLPREALTVRGQDPKLVVGYVLNDMGGWTSVLHSGDRKMLWLKSDMIIGRRVCPGPRSNESTWQLIDRRWFGYRQRVQADSCRAQILGPFRACRPTTWSFQRGDIEVSGTRPGRVIGWRALTGM
jgi:hypothetical protein